MGLILMAEGHAEAIRTVAKAHADRIKVVNENSTKEIL